MYKFSSAFFFFLLGAFIVRAQILPKEGSGLNYRIVGFSFPMEHGINNYKIEIATGNINSEDSFIKNKIQSTEVAGNSVIIEVPFFKSQYTWRTVYTAKGSKNIYSPFHHFSTGYCPEIDSNNIRISILKPAEKYKDAYFFLDNCRALYDMEGKPVWYLPDSNEFKDLPLDVKRSPQGTITFILNKNAYEVNFNGDILWETPNTGAVSGDSVEHYHHQFSRLADGNYMVMGTKTGYVLKQTPDSVFKDFVIDDDRSQKLVYDNNYQPFPFGTLIEYDGKGKIIWSWKLSSYFKSSDLCYYRRAGKPVDFNMRENSFYFDEKNKVIYLSLKVCSRILKIAYPQGNVMDTYGEKFKAGAPDEKNGIFYGQHACNISKNGYLYLYNNNMRDSTCMPEVLLLKETHPGLGGLEKIWEYKCKGDGVSYSKQAWFTLAVGGNVSELPDGSMFVTMGGAYSKIFIVNRDDEILWSVFCENWDKHENKWIPKPQYRGSMISHKDLERLIWDAETKRK